MTFHRVFHRKTILLAAWLSVVLAQISFAPAPVYAGNDYDSICGSTDLKDSSAITQKREYCKAAKDAKKAAKSNGLLWKVWAGVTTVCTAACVSSVMGHMLMSQWVCIGSSTAAGVTDAVMTKEYMSAVMSIGGAAGGYMVNQMMNSNKPDDKKRDYGACLTAATSAVTTFMKYNSEKNSKKSADKNLEAAKSVTDPNAASLDASSIPIPNANLNQANIGSSGSTQTATLGSDSVAQSAVCDNARSSRNTNAMLQCAAAMDNSLPSFVKDAKFQKNFQKVSGQSLGDFLADEGGDPSSAIAGSMGSLNASQVKTLAAALQKMDTMVDSEVPESTYASSSGAVPEEEMDPALGEMLAGLMEQLAPKGEGNADPKSGIRAVAYANQKNSAMAVAHNKSLSIFDRVSYRYYFVGKRLTLIGPSGGKQ